MHHPHHSHVQCEHIVPAACGGGWTCRTCPAASKTSFWRAGTSAPMCMGGWLHACRKDHG